MKWVSDFFIDTLTDKISREKLDGLIRPYGTDMRVLDIGGARLPAYRTYFPNRVVLDIKADRGVDIVADAQQMPFPDGAFDLILCVALLEHLEDPVRAIAEMRRVLKPGGRIIISVPFLFPMHDTPGDYWRFTKFGLQKLFAQGWEIEKLVGETTTQEAFAVLLQRVGYQSTLVWNRFMKVVLFLLVKVISKMPNLIRQGYGDITKKTREPEAFTSSFFLVARKSS